MGGSAQSLSADAHAETRRKNHFRDMAGPMSASDLSAFVFDDRRVWLPHWRRAFHLDVVGCKKTKIGREPQNQCDVSGYRGLGCPSGNAAQAQAAAAHTPACYDTPAYSDLDRNRHVNNARYISWVCDCFAPERYENQTILDLEINYLQQAFAGEKIRMEIEEQGASFLIQGNNDETDVPLFRAAGTFAKSE